MSKQAFDYLADALRYSNAAITATSPEQRNKLIRKSNLSLLFFECASCGFDLGAASRDGFQPANESKRLPVVSIRFGHEYAYRGGENFQPLLESALQHAGYQLGSLSYAPTGQGGSVFVDDRMLSFADEEEHPVLEAIKRAEAAFNELYL